METTKRPSPDRIIAVVNTILQRRYDVKIDYILKTEGGHHEQHQPHH